MERTDERRIRPKASRAPPLPRPFRPASARPPPSPGRTTFATHGASSTSSRPGSASFQHHRPTGPAASRPERLRRPREAPGLPAPRQSPPAWPHRLQVDMSQDQIKIRVYRSPYVPSRPFPYITRRSRSPKPRPRARPRPRPRNGSSKALAGPCSRLIDLFRVPHARQLRRAPHRHDHGLAHHRPRDAGASGSRVADRQGASSRSSPRAPAAREGQRPRNQPTLQQRRSSRSLRSSSRGASPRGTRPS